MLRMFAPTPNRAQAAAKRSAVVAWAGRFASCAVVGLASWVGSVDAQVTPIPEPLGSGEQANTLPEVKLDDARGRQLPLDLVFQDAKGQDVQLKEALKDGKPLVLMLGYYQCPELCSLVMNGMLKSFKGMEANGFVLGEDFNALTISIDPRETPKLAADKKARYAEQVAEPAALKAGWGMWVSPDATQVESLAKTLGFGYRYVKQTDMYGHAAAIYIVSPDGLVTRMMYGLDYKPSDLRLSLVEASDGKIGSKLDQLILTCFRWDQAKGQYTPFALGLLSIVAAVFLLAVVGVIILMATSETNRKRRMLERELKLAAKSQPLPDPNPAELP